MSAKEKAKTFLKDKSSCPTGQGELTQEKFRGQKMWQQRKKKLLPDESLTMDENCKDDWWYLHSARVTVLH